MRPAWPDPGGMCDFDEPVLLGALLARQSVHAMSIEALVRMLDREHAAIRTADGLSALDRDGVAHRHARFAWPTRAALRADGLAPV